ncbi:GNAT family N-acetyltransferase [Peribacillus butanolivorans]|uniref:GNAT family N-acetyltransferase n=1 Tax=Peribacillus butanolivorans TaxID=421767 RepID=UPI0039FC623B
MTDFAIRLATPEDRKEIFNVHRHSVRNLCSEQYTEEQINMWLGGRDPDIYLPAIERGELWVAVSDRTILGFVEVEGNEVTKLFVSGAAAGSGVGKSLMVKVIGHIRKNGKTRIYLEATTTARDFYRKLGFVETGTGTFSRGGAAVSLEIVKMELV